MADTDSVRATIATRLRAAREQAGLSQGQVAKLLGLQRPSISELEAGRRRVSAEEVSRFAEIYNVSVSWLMKQESEVPDPAVELAARELAKLRKEDLETVLNVLRTFQKAKKDDR
jgi:transcriptional regulator with XRE-family HTH domain